MSENEYSFHGDLSLEAEMAGIEASDDLARSIEEDGHHLTTDERLMIQAMLAPGIAHFYDLANQAGQLAGAGDVLGAFSLIGGIDNARELLGDEQVDALLAGLGDDPESFTSEES